MTDSPYKSMVELPREGLVMQELHTYEIRDNRMVKTVMTRKFHKDDYVDSETNIPLGELK
jgi:hypothetical protein